MKQHPESQNITVNIPRIESKLLDGQKNNNNNTALTWEKIVTDNTNEMTVMWELSNKHFNHLL